jgi:hypothetical protein
MFRRSAAYAYRTSCEALAAIKMAMADIKGKHMRRHADRILAPDRTGAAVPLVLLRVEGERIRAATMRAGTRMLLPLPRELQPQPRRSFRDRHSARLFDEDNKAASQTWPPTVAQETWKNGELL